MQTIPCDFCFTGDATLRINFKDFCINCAEKYGHGRERKQKIKEVVVKVEKPIVKKFIKKRHTDSELVKIIHEFFSTFRDKSFSIEEIFEEFPDEKKYRISIAVNFLYKNGKLFRKTVSIKDKQRCYYYLIKTKNEKEDVRLNELALKIKEILMKNDYCSTNQLAEQLGVTGTWVKKTCDKYLYEVVEVMKVYQNNFFIYKDERYQYKVKKLLSVAMYLDDKEARVN